MAEARSLRRPAGLLPRSRPGIITVADKVVVDNWHYVSPHIPELKMLIQEERFGFGEVIVYIALGIWGEYAAILPEVCRRALALGLGQRLSPNH